MTPIEKLQAKLPGAKKSGNGWSALCPAHEDHLPSLRISEGDDGRALVHCHAGCTVEAVVATIGLTIRDLMPERDHPTSTRKGKPSSGSQTFPTANAAVVELERRHGKCSAFWTYHDMSGNPVGLVVRWDRADGKKEIRPVSRHGNGWRIGAMPEPRPLYGLPELAGANRVLVVEGEKCADAARSLGFTATTSAGGAQAANKTDWRSLAGKEVWILPDNDAPGRGYTDTTAGLLVKLNPTTMVKLIELPGLPPGGDIADWIDAHGDAAEPEGMRAEIEALAAEVEPLNLKKEPSVGGDSEQWPDPVPLRSGFDPPPFPVDALPPWMRNYVLGLAEEKQVPVDLPAMLALGAASAGIARKVTVSPWPGWDHEPTNLYVFCSLPPGERKSQTFSAVFAPVMALEASLRERAEPVVNEAESAFRVAQKRVDHLEAKISKTDDAEGRDKLKEDLRVAQEELRAIDVPAMPLLRVDDDTPEMMALELVKQHGRLLAASPEARTLENMDSYSDKPNIDVFLKAHAGDDLRSGRISRGRDSVTRPALTCVFSPQPYVLEMLGEMYELRGRGWLARWLYGLPRSAVGFRKVRAKAVPGEVRAAYESGLLGMWRVEYFDVIEETPVDLTLSAEASAELEAFEVWKEILLRPGGELSSCGGWGNKLGGLCVRVAGILHVADGILAGDAWKVTPIRAEVIRRAVEFCKSYAIPHALAAFDLMGSTDTMIGARAVLKWISKRPDPTAEFSKRDAFNGCRGTFDGVDDLQPCLDLLERHYLIRPEPHPTPRSGAGRHPSPVYQVNPRAFEGTTPAQNPHNAQNS
jgi:putative DNA primase/helicase